MWPGARRRRPATPARAAADSAARSTSPQNWTTDAPGARSASQRASAAVSTGCAAGRSATSTTSQRSSTGPSLSRSRVSSCAPADLRPRSMYARNGLSQSSSSRLEPHGDARVAQQPHGHGPERGEDVDGRVALVRARDPDAAEAARVEVDVRGAELPGLVHERDRGAGLHAPHRLPVERPQVPAVGDDVRVLERCRGLALEQHDRSRPRPPRRASCSVDASTSSAVPKRLSLATAWTSRAPARAAITGVTA